MVDKAIDPKKLVEQGYDRIAGRHHEWGGQARPGEKARHAAALFDRLPDGAAVLELGCGSGSSTTTRLAERFRLTGVDISARQIELICQAIPAATFIQADMATLDFPAASFDAVAAFYSIIHLPRGEHAGLLRRIATWLRPGGLLVATMGARSTEVGYEHDWLGAPMYWSHFDSETNRRLVEQAGLTLLAAQEETAEEHGTPSTFLWVVARKDTSWGLAAPATQHRILSEGGYVVMTQEQRSLPQAMADRLTAKLQAFYDGLPHEEQQVLELLLLQAGSEGDAEGYNVGAFLQVGPIVGASPNDDTLPNSRQITVPLTFP